MSKETSIDAFYDRADQYASEGRYEEAIDLYRKLAAIHPENESIIMSLAWAYRDSGKVSDAIRCLEGLLEKELKRTTFTGFAFDELVRIYREERDYRRLVAICEKAVRVQPDDLSIMTTLGDAYLKAGNSKKAVETFATLTEMEPGAPALFCRLGDAHIAAGDYENGEDAYGKAIAVDPTDAHRFYGALGNALSREGQYQRAENALQQSRERRPDQPLVRCSLGDTLIKQGRLDEAWMAYEEAIRLDPPGAGRYYNRLGNILAGEDLHAPAVEAFEKAVSEDPRNPFYCLSLVKSCEAEGLHEKARTAYERARSLGVFS